VNLVDKPNLETCSDEEFLAWIATQPETVDLGPVEEIWIGGKQI
jgi:hypothetical protein